ncbi:MAG TPA: mannose-6-phosphate isomerase, class I [Sphaerochaeta sp.]|nr:mannose-6-phosphate isomerase, class I [Sphaerochaeta sp.]
MNIVEITGVVQEYAWGNTHFISTLLGQEEDGKPKAELWFATHPDGPSVVNESGELLADFLEKDPEHWLGLHHLSRYGMRLPLLLKVLAIDQPLSLQVHPSEEQAQQGWKREKSVRKRLDKAFWNYKDPYGKPEMAYVLTPTTLLCGFRPLKQILEDLQALIPKAYAEHFSVITTVQESEGISLLFRTLYGLEVDQQRALLNEFLASVPKPKQSDSEFVSKEALVHWLAEVYPGDPGIIAPYLLHLLHLEPKEALYIETGILHAYIRGNVVELMSASDNVLRAGLTAKKVDLDELLRVVSTAVDPVERAPTLVGTSGRLHILTPTEDFHLMVLEEGSYTIVDRHSIELLFVTEGSARFIAEGEEKLLEQGRCYVIAEALPTYRLEVSGTLFVADVPR